MNKGVIEDFTTKGITKEAIVKEMLALYPYFLVVFCPEAMCRVNWKIFESGEITQS